MDAIELLMQKHRDVEDLFEEIEEAEASEKREIFEEIADQLTIHATIEERHFYPAVKDDERTSALVMESLEEHLAVKRLLADLLDIEPKDATFDAKIAVLKEQVQHHVKEEEKELFPKVRKALDAEILTALAQEMTATQEALLDEGEPPRLIKEQTAAAPALG